MEGKVLPENDMSDDDAVGVGSNWRTNYDSQRVVSSRATLPTACPLLLNMGGVSPNFIMGTCIHRPKDDSRLHC